MDSELIWQRLVAAAADPSTVGSDPQRRALLSAAMSVGTTVTDDCVGCSITETVDDGFHTPVASGGLALSLDHVQYLDGSGPCVAACRDGRVHRIVDMADERAFPVFVRAAVDKGVFSSLSLPLPLRRPSALNLYARSTAAFEDDKVNAVAGLLARCTRAVLGADPFELSQPTSAEGRDPQPPPHPPRNADFDRAVAVLCEDDDLDGADAFARLSQRSYAEMRSIFEVSRDVTAERRGGGATT